MQIRQTVARGASMLLERALREDTSADKIELAVRKELQRDSDFIFLVHAYQNKFGLKENVFALPVINPDSLNIEGWKFQIDHETFKSFRGLDEVKEYITECVLTKGDKHNEKVEEIENFLKTI